MDKKDISIFLLALLTVVFIFKLESRRKNNDNESLAASNHETSYGASLVEFNLDPKTYEEALQQSKDANKPIFIYFQADWCGYCKQMKKNVFSKNEVKKYLSENYIKLFVDVDQDEATKNKFKIRSLPTYLVISPEGEIIQKHSGYLDAINFMSWLEPKINATHLVN